MVIKLIYFICIWDFLYFIFMHFKSINLSDVYRFMYVSDIQIHYDCFFYYLNILDFTYSWRRDIIYREIWNICPPFYFCPNCQWANLRQNKTIFSYIHVYSNYYVGMTFKMGETVCECREKKITWVKNYLV